MYNTYVQNIIKYMNTTNSTPTQPSVQNTTISSPVPQPPLPQESGPNYFIYIIAVLVLIAVFFIISKRKAKGNKKQIGVVGERGSGKTQLWLALSGGKSFDTVPSISNNISHIDLGAHKYQLTDFIGDNLSKEEVISQIARFHTLVHVVDGTDSKKLGDAALFIYRVLVSKQFQKEPCNYLVFLNKNDQKGFYGAEKLVKRIEDEVETIKISRRNLTEENQDGEQDYLRNERTRFDLKKQGIQILTGSAKQNRKGLQTQLEELCG